MANRFVRSTGGNWNAAATWESQSGLKDTVAVPTVNDDVYCDAQSGQLTINTTTCACKTFNCTGYANTLTLTAAMVLGVSGNVTLGSGMTITGTGRIAFNATSTLTSNGKVISGGVYFNATATFTLADPMSVTGSAIIQTGDPTINGYTLTVAGGWTANRDTSGTTEIILTGGTYSGVWHIANNLTLNGNITFSSVLWYKTGTLKYLSGTMTTPSLMLLQTASLQTAGMNWVNVTNYYAGSYTLLSNFSCTGTFSANYDITFTGSYTISTGAFTIATSKTVTLSGALDINGTFTINAGGVIACGTNQVNCSGALSMLNTSSTAWRTGNNKFVFDGTSGALTTNATALGATFYDLEIAAGRTLTITAGNTIDITGTFSALGTAGSLSSIASVTASSFANVHVATLGTMAYLNSTDIDFSGGIFILSSFGSITRSRRIFNKYLSASGGTRSWADTTGTWVTTSGGSTAATAPTATDSILCEAASGDLTLNATTMACSEFCCHSSYVGTITHSNAATYNIATSSDVTFSSGMTFTTQTPNNGGWTFNSCYITSNGKQFGNIGKGTGGVYNFVDDFYCMDFYAVGNLTFNGAGIVSMGSITIRTTSCTIIGTNPTYIRGPAASTVGTSTTTITLYNEGNDIYIGSDLSCGAFGGSKTWRFVGDGTAGYNQNLNKWGSSNQFINGGPTLVFNTAGTVTINRSSTISPIGSGVKWVYTAGTVAWGSTTSWNQSGACWYNCNGMNWLTFNASGYAVNLQSNMQVMGTYNQGSSTVRWNDDYTMRVGTFNIGSTTFTTPPTAHKFIANTIAFTGAMIINGDPIETGNFSSTGNISGTSTLILKSTGTFNYGASYQISVNIDMDIGAGTLTFPSTTTGGYLTGTFRWISGLFYQGTGMRINGSCTLDVNTGSTATGIPLTPYGANMTITLANTLYSSTLAIDQEYMTFTGGYTVNVGTTLVRANSTPTVGKVTVTIDGPVNWGAVQLNIAGSGTGKEWVIVGNYPMTMGAVTGANSCTLSFPNTIPMESMVCTGVTYTLNNTALDISGSLTIGAAGVLACGTNQVNLAGDLILSNTSATAWRTGNNKFVFDGNSLINSNSTAGGATFYDLEIAAGATLTLKATHVFTVLGTFDSSGMISNHAIIKSSVASSYAHFDVANLGVIYWTDATDIDSATGTAILTNGGTLTRTINWTSVAPSSDINIPIIWEDMAVAEWADLSLTPLFTGDLYDDITIAEDVDCRLVHLAFAFDNIDIAEDVELLDLGVEVTAEDYAWVVESVELWMDWCNEWSAFDLVHVLEYFKIGLDPFDIPEIVSSISIAEYAAIAPWIQSAEAWDDILIEDIVDRILVGHFLYPVDTITVADVLVNATVFPPFPFPVQNIVIAEWVGFALSPPSLSWIKEYIYPQEDVVVGLDPHYADLGHQNLNIAENVVIGVTPLRIEVEDLGDHFPVITEWVRWSVGQPVYGYDDLAIADELTNIYLDVLFPRGTYDSVTISEETDFYWLDLPATVHDSAHITEVITVVFASASVDVGEDITIEENVDYWVGQEISVIDNIYIAEWVSLLDLEIDVGPAVQNITVAEWITIAPFYLFVDVGDDITAAEDFSYFCGQEISVIDSVTIDEYVLPSLDLYFINKFDSISHTETATAKTSPLVSVIDSITIAEWVNANYETLFVGVYDDLSSIEDVAFELLNNIYIDIYDDVNIAETIEAAETLAIDAYESIDISEDFASSVPDLSRYDSITVAEYVQISLPYFSISQDITISEHVALDLLTYIDVSDEITVEDWVDVSVILGIFAIDIINIGEQIEASLPYFSVHDSISIAESASGLVSPLAFAYDSIAISELAAMLTSPLLETYEDIGVEEYAAGAYWIIDLAIYDEISASEDLAFEFISDLELAASEDVAIAEDIATLYDWGITVNDNIAVAEDVEASAPSFSVYDSIAISESGTAKLPPYFSIYDSIDISESVAASLPYFSVYQDIGITDYAAIAPFFLFLSAGDDIHVADPATAENSWEIIVHDYIGLAEIYTRLILDPLSINVYDQIPYVFESFTVEPLTRFINVHDHIAIASSVAFSGLPYGIYAHEHIAIAELFKTTDFIIWLYVDEDFSIEDSAYAQGEYAISVFEDVAIEAIADIYLTFMLVAEDSISAHDIINIGLSILDIATHESISVAEITALLVGYLNILVWESIATSEYYFYFCDTNLHLYATEDVLAEEWVRVYPILFAYGFNDAGVDEYVEVSLTALFVSANDSIHISESPAARFNWLAFVYDSISTFEVYNNDDTVVFFGELELISVEEAVIMETTGTNIYPFRNVYVQEHVSIELDSLYAFAREEIIRVNEFTNFGNIFMTEDIWIWDIALVALETLFADLSDSVSVVEYYHGIVYGTGEGNAEAEEDVALAEAINISLDVLRTGIQVEFIGVSDVLDYIVCGTLVEASENVFLDEAVTAEISALNIFVADWVTFKDKAGAWLFIDNAIQTAEDNDVDEWAQIIIGPLIIDVYDDLAVEEYAERLEGLNPEFTFDDLCILEDVAEVSLAELNINVREYISTTEFNLLTGLLVVVSVVDEIHLNERLTLRVPDLYIDLFDIIAFEENLETLLWNAVTPPLLYEAIGLQDSATVAFSYGDIIVKERYSFWVHEHVYMQLSHLNIPQAADFPKIAEWAKVDVQPCDAVAYDESVVEESVELAIYYALVAIDDIGVQEDVLLMLFPPFPAVQDSISVSEYISIIYDPWVTGVFDSITVISERAYLYVFMGSLTPFIDNISIEESVSLKLAQTEWNFGVAENFSVVEWFAQGLDPIPLSIEDLIYIVDHANMTDLVIDLYAEDLASIVDAASVQYDLLTGVYEQVAVGETVDESLGIGLSVLDTSVIFESIGRYLGIDLARFDSIHVVDYGSMVYKVGLIVVDEIMVEEHVSELISRLYASVRDLVSVIEAANLYEGIAFSKYDSVVVSHGLSVSIAELIISVVQTLSILDLAWSVRHPLVTVYDTIIITEYFKTYIDRLMVAAQEAVAVAEYAPALLPRLYASVREQISLYDSASTFLPWLSASVRDSIAVVESVSRTYGTLKPNVYDPIAVSELVQRIAGILFASRSDAIIITESAVSWLDAWAVFVKDSISQSEYAKALISIDVFGITDIWVSSYGSGSLNRLYTAAFDSISIEELAGLTYIHGLKVWDLVAAGEYRIIDLSIGLFSYQSVRIAESIARYMDISFGIFDEISIDEAIESIITILYIFAHTLVIIDSICYTLLDYDVNIYDSVDVYESVVWGLPIQFISVVDLIDASEDNGVHVIPYVLYPILFDTFERGVS